MRKNCVRVNKRLWFRAPRFGLMLMIGVWLTSCTLRLGGSSRLSDPPAPTTIPLQTTSQPPTLPGLVSPPQPIGLPPGFAIGVFASGLNGPRMLAVGPDGQLYVAERSANRIVRLPDLDTDGRADRIQVVADDLRNPSSLAFFQDGSLYIGETRRVLRLSKPDPQGVFQHRQVIIDGLPSGGHHTRTLLFSPDWGSLFVSVGSSCNVCEEEDPRRAAILRYNPDGSGEQIYASGLRNAVGITFRPGTSELWVTNNGRDMMGDDLPPETIYRVQPGEDYGWPHCHAGRIVDPEFGSSNSCQGVPPPQVEMQAHSAPLGLAFYDGLQFPREYQGGLFVAFHGSWNRTIPTGYKVIFIPFNQGAPGPVYDFAVGWLQDKTAWGRPVDVIVGPDGSLYLSDDGAGLIYRIFYYGS